MNMNLAEIKKTIHDEYCRKDSSDDNRWTVYIHIVSKKISGYDWDKYYVGITKQKPKYRWNNGNGYLKGYMRNAIQKYGWDNIQHEIIIDHISEKEAKELECHLIALLKSNNSQYGYNLTDGGDGTRGKTSSKTQKECARKLLKCKWENNSFRQKMSGRNQHKAVSVILLNTGEVFDTETQAAKTYNFTTHQISNYCSGKVNCMSVDDNGYYLKWMKYVDAVNLSEDEIQSIIRSDVKPIRLNPYVCLNTDEIFYYAADVYKKYHLRSSSLTACCSGNTKSCGVMSDGCPMVWAFYDDYMKMSDDEKEEKIRLAMMHNTTMLVDIKTNTLYKSIDDCVSYTGFSKRMIRKILYDEVSSNHKEKHRFQYFVDYLVHNNLGYNEARKSLIFVA